jgi:uncharacterized protein
MLLEFTVGNYLSFKDKVTISMVASSKRELRDTNVINNVKKGLSLLKSSVIYGANASGKSNLFSALGFMLKFIKNSYKESQAGETIDVFPFQLDTTTISEASFFELVFCIDKIVYRYGFEATSKEVFKEWLYIQKGVSEKNVFMRQKDKLCINNLTLENEVKNVPIKLRENGLYLSALSMYGIKFGTNIMEWLGKQIIISSGKRSSDFNFTEKDKIEVVKQEMLAFLKAADFNIVDYEIDQKTDVNLICTIKNQTAQENYLLWHILFY